MKKHRFCITVLSVLLGVFFLTSSVFADENVQELKNQIEELKAKVAALEARQTKPNVLNSPRIVDPINDWDPMAEMALMHHQMQQMFEQAFGQSPKQHRGMFSNRLSFDDTKIEQTKDGYLIKLDMAGFDKDKIDIKAQNGSLTISGEYKAQEKRESQSGVMESHRMGRFLNSIPLPEDADVSKMKTEKKGNTLEMFIPKRK